MLEIKEQLVTLTNDEKKIHVIWIGKLPEGELDNLKIWANLNQDFEIHIWIDSDHILSPMFKNIIHKKSKDNVDNESKNNLLSVLEWQLEFYWNYHLKNSDKNFEQNVKNFLINLGWQTEKELNEFINQSKENMQKSIIELEKYTTNKIFIRDVSLESKSIFEKNSKYYEYYLMELEQSNFAVIASDLLRYQILRKEGGVYIDTDLLPKIDIKKINIYNEKIKNLLNELYPYKKLMNFNFQEVIINELMKLNYFEKLNDDNVLFLQKELEKQLSNVTLDIYYLKELGKQLEKVQWQNYVKIKLSELHVYQIFNFAMISKSSLKKEYSFFNGFLISKKETKIWELTTNRLINYYQKITSNKEANFIHNFQNLYNNMHVIQNTGPGLIVECAKTINNKFSHCLVFQACSLETLNNIKSNWLYSKSLQNDNLVNIKRKFIEQRSPWQLNFHPTKELKQLLEIHLSNIEKLLTRKWTNICEVSNTLIKEKEKTEFLTLQKTWSFLNENLEKIKELENEQVKRTNKVWEEKNDSKKRKRIANALGFEKDKAKVNSEASTSKSQSSSSKSQKM